MIHPDLIRRIPLLKDLPDEEIEALGEVLHRKKYKKNTFIVHSHDSDAELLFILEGQANVTLIGGDAREVILTQFGPGEFFGELALLTGEDRSANVVAASDCELLVLSKENFQQHLKDNSGLSLALLRELALRLRNSSTKIGSLALLDVYRRVAQVLQELAEEQEVDGSLLRVIEKRPTHKDLAAMAGTSREMVTRALKSLEEDKLIGVDGKRIEVYAVPGECY